MLKVAWWKDHNNFGDWLTPALLKKLLKIECEWAEPVDADFIGAGSYLDTFNNYPFTGTVWGTGIMSRDSYPDLSHARVLALRGVNTKTHCKSHCIVLGDPGLLASSLVKEDIPVNHDIGFIPHWNDKETVVEGAYKIKITNSIETVIKDAMSCKRIVSTSLHGLILADSLGLPRMWKYTDANPGEGFKFYDYQSVFSIPLKMNEWQIMPRMEVKKIKKQLLDALKKMNE
jgi:pyruvyltransferase